MSDTQRDTPRVNAIVRPWSSQDRYVAMAELARTLERELADMRARFRDEEERHALLQSRCYEGFASATDGIFDALREQDEQVTALRAALKWALCHAEAREEDADFHAEYAKAHAALRGTQEGGRLEP